MTKRVIVSGLVAGFVIAALNACSSAPKDEGAARPSIGTPEAGAPSAPETTEADVVVEAPIERPVTGRRSSLDSRYEPLMKAVRSSGKASLIQEEASRLLGVNPNDPVALNTIALLHLRRGRPRAAKLLLTRALERNQPTPALHNNLGVALMDDGESEAAALEFKKALQLDDRHAEALGNLGSIYAQGGDFERAFLYLESSYKLNRTNAAVANNYALALRERKDYEAASRVYDDILKAHPKDVPALLNYAILLIDYMNKPKDGLDLVFKLKFQETQRKDVLARANALEKKAKSELK